MSRGFRIALGLTVASAGLLAATFPPVELGVLGWIALAPLFAACALVSPARAAVCGLLWGILYAYGVGWWFPGMIADYFERPAWVGWVVLIVVGGGLCGVYVATFAAWVSWLARRGGAGPIVIAAGWTAYELARARLLVGNPWALSGYSQVRFPTVMQIADATGPYGVGFLLAAVNACVAGLAMATLRGRRPVLARVTVAALVLATLGYGAWRRGQSFVDGAPLTVAVVQGAPEARTSDVARQLALSRTAASAAPDLVVWPENSIDFSLQDASAPAKAVLAASTELGADFIVGGPHFAPGADGAVAHNSIFLVHKGAVAGRYDKVHLMPFAEVVTPTPGSDVVPYLPGRRLLRLRGAIGEIGSFVCFEAMYPELIRRLADPGAELLVNLSNDRWFGHAASARHHLDLASVRAIENRRYLVRAASTGISSVVDPYGQPVALSAFGRPDVLIAEVRRGRTRTPYHRWGDAPAWAAVAVAVAATIRTTRRRAA